MRITSWNVNGIRAAAKKGLLDWIKQDGGDVICLQETKAHPEQLDGGLQNPKGYEAYFCPAERKGYSGTAIYARSESRPLAVHTTTGAEGLDGEGRVLIAEYIDFYLFNVYFPNGRASLQRLDYKMEFYQKFLDYIQNIRKTTGRGIIVCGDFNTAHQEIDLARPKENGKTSGFLPMERDWLDRLIAAGYHDTFRLFCSEGERYSWWDMRTRARERNSGWRLDYFFISSELLPLLKDAFILPDVAGSDHCPVGIELDY